MRRKLQNMIGYTLAVAVAVGLGETAANRLTSPNSSANTVAAAESDKVASIAYAGSLQYVNDTILGPAFTKATGFQYEGRGGGSFAMAHLIATNEIAPQVFESVGTAPFADMGSHKPKWAIGFASSPLVIAYSPSSPYAKQLRAIAKGRQPLSKLFQLMEQPKFHLGRTDPNTDPQGQAFLLMMQLAERQLHLPKGTAQKVLGPMENPQQVFDEEAILARLQAGQLDATSAYLPEAIQHHLPYIALPKTIDLGDPAEKSLYAKAHLKVAGKVVTGKPIEIYVTLIPGEAGSSQAGEKFISFLLSKQGRKIYGQNGYTLTKSSIWGSAAAIPHSIRPKNGK